MTATKTNERPGTRAQVKFVRTSPFKVRVVLDLIRGLDVAAAEDVLLHTDRGSADVILKLLQSAVANAGHNDSAPPEELFVSACYADEGPTLKRWRPRARGRATRIRKRTCHITIIVSRLEGDALERLRGKQAAAYTGRGSTAAPADDSGAGNRESRRRRVAKSKEADSGDDEAVEEATAETEEATAETEETVEDQVVEEVGTEEMASDDVETEDTPDVEADEGGEA